jgi:hypothetical protein
MHPHVMIRLREEVITKVGPTNRPTYDNIREMKYLRAVINGMLTFLGLSPVLTFEFFGICQKL